LTPFHHRRHPQDQRGQVRQKGDPGAVQEHLYEIAALLWVMMPPHLICSTPEKISGG